MLVLLSSVFYSPGIRPKVQVLCLIRNKILIPLPFLSFPTWKLTSRIIGEPSVCTCKRQSAIHSAH